MSDQHPGVEDEVEAALRLGLATASQYARARQDSARQAEHRAQQEAHQLEARYRAEGASATARLAVIDRPEWWDRAAPADITSMWQLAAQWQHEQPRAAVAADTITRQVQDRYGIDIGNSGIDPVTLRAELARLDEDQRDRADRSQMQDDTASALGAVLLAEQRDAVLAEPSRRSETVMVGEESEVDETALIELATGQYDRPASDERAPARSADELRALTDDAGPLVSWRPSPVTVAGTPVDASPVPPYDSMERREQTAANLYEAGLPAEAIDIAMRADVAHAHPVVEAVGISAAWSRGTSSRSVSRGAQRPDRGR